MSFRVVVLVSLVFVGLSSCRQRPGDSPLIGGNSKFALNLYRELSNAAAATGDGDGNLVFSPLGISLALGLTSLGARGRTRREIVAALGVAGGRTRGRRGLHGYFGKVGRRLRRLSRLKSYDVGLASRVFADGGLEPRRRFVRRARTFYHAGVERLNFTDPAGSAERINGWVSEATRAKISGLVSADDIGPESRLFLASVVHFRADWAQRFDRRATEEQEFRVDGDGNRTVRVPMMHLVRMRLNYSELDDGLRAVELPYVGGEASMILILPPGSGNRSPSGLDDWVRSLRMTEEFVTVSVPRFRVASDFRLDEHLERLGVGRLFDDSRADLTGIARAERLRVSRTAHKAAIEVGEDGSEAAAASGVLVTTRSERFTRRFVADRPFLFVVRDNGSGLALFVGRVARPEP